MDTVKFISCDGVFPHLCAGTLVLNIKGKDVALKNALITGGSIWFDEHNIEHVYYGDWELREISAEYEEYREEILKVVNKNVRCGCCGGCV